MIIVSRGAVQGVASAITDALVGACDHRGRQYICPTIDPQKLQDIALGVITMVAGQVVWPSNETLEVHVDDHLPWLRKTYQGQPNR